MNDHEVLNNDIKASILKTKLFPPPTRTNTVFRERLIKKLSLYPGHKLTFVSAAAGYGKTTLVSEWIRQINACFAWLSLDNGDSDEAKFITYLVAALHKMDEQIGSGLQGVEPTKLCAINDVVKKLVNDITRIKYDFVLILDDFHTINNRKIIEAIHFLITNQPNNMHLIILSRKRIPMKVSRLRARGEIIEIYAKDLCFTEEETEEFFFKTVKVDIDKNAIRTLGKCTEGWVTGLQLAGLSIKKLDIKKITKFIIDFSGSNNYIIDFLVDEVIEQLDSEMCIFLYHTSVLDRFNASLCDCIMEIKRSKRLIEQLHDMNLFIIPLDEEGEWFRYHHLFSDFLRSGLGKIERSMLHMRAAKWFEEKGLLEEAIKHAMKVKNTGESERIITKAALYDVPFRNESMNVANNIYPGTSNKVMVKSNKLNSKESVLYKERSDSKVKEQVQRNCISLNNTLTDREMEVLKLIAAGLSNQDISKELVITIGTTKSHINNIFSKLCVARRTQAVATAKELGIL